MRRLIFPHVLAPFPTYRSMRRAFHRAVARVSVSFVLVNSPSLVVSLGAKALFSAKSDARFLLGRISDSLR
jgi:hypothetical protein